jgi:hypothetical protein
MLIFMGIGHDLLYVHPCSNKDRLPSCSRHPFGSVIFPFTVSRMVVVRWQIAFYSYVSSYLAFSRKYGTVWYHPASSKLWYLTALSFVNFQEKLTGTSFAPCVCEASFVRLAV